MKKLLIALSMAALFSGSALADEVEESFEIEAIGGDPIELAKNAVKDGNVNFYGEIVQHTCSIKTESQNQTVTLSRLLVDDLNNKKSGAGVTHFAIKLENCTQFNDKFVSLLFKPTSDKVEGELLKNQAAEEQKAKNVFVKVKNGEHYVDFSKTTAVEQKVEAVSLSGNHDTKFDFYAEYYVKPEDTASAGMFQFTLPFSIDYR
ncbi:fimbrial protein [Pasteurella sp. PK-2025]|uniref:fimbrial protein n=1 Tax=Pasteurella sp. PK-2025 TaxID=3413133 RepID=UPI003C739403